MKAFVVYNLVLFVLSFKNSYKPFRATSNKTISYIQAEYYTQTKQSYNYRLSLALFMLS